MIFTPLKLLSALIIVGACFFAGASVAEAENTSYRQLSGILALLAHIRTRITYTHFSLEVIFADFYDDALEKCGFLACLKDARGGYSASFCEAVGRLTATGETRDALLAFGRHARRRFDARAIRSAGDHRSVFAGKSGTPA